MQATRAIIHLKNLRRNIGAIKQHTTIKGHHPEICMAVKADAYGHGAVEIAKAALSAGVGYFGVATVQEGIELREAGIDTPILLFSLPLPEELEALCLHSIATVAADIDLVKLIEKESEKHRVTGYIHLKVDTGMGRIGCFPGDALEIVKYIDNSRYLSLGGICTHFSDADSENRDFRKKQLSIFNNLLGAIGEKGFFTGIIHAANSGAIIDFPESYFDMIRPGITAYGYYPSNTQKERLSLKPVMSLESRIVFKKRVKRGTPISYGRTYRPDRDTVIATLPAGYGDGYSRLLSNKAGVLIRGKQYPVAGRICMDQLMIDLGPNGNRIKLYEKAILFGSEKGAQDAGDLAKIIGTIPYEITCNINKRVPRLYC